MRVLGTILLLGLLLAVLRVALVALALGLLLLLTHAFVSRPAQAIGFLGAMTLVGLASARPLAFIVALSVVALATRLAGRWRAGRKPVAPE